MDVHATGRRWKIDGVGAIALLLVMAGLALASRHWLLQAAAERALDEARLVMAAADAVRGYHAQEVRDLLLPGMRDEFLPQTVGSYAATQTLARMQQSLPGYAYKEAVLNPTNPRDRAQGWEVDVVQFFQQDATLAERVLVQPLAGGTAAVVARPIRVNSPTCLQCHSSPAAAPDSLLRRYGSEGGFGWRYQEVVGAQLAMVPLEGARVQALRLWWQLMGAGAIAMVVLLGAAWWRGRRRAIGDL